MVDRSVRRLGFVAGVVVAGPLVLLVGVPLVATFLEWLVGVPAAYLVEIPPRRRRAS